MHTPYPMEQAGNQENVRHSATERSAPLENAQTNIIDLSAGRVNRLPWYETDPGRLEKLAFRTLNLGALALVSLALWNANRYALNRDQISRTLSDRLIPTLAISTNPIPGEASPIPAKAVEQTAGVPRWQSPKS